ncbi:MAG: hypothetical protein AUJ92_15465 [Armatimonadetes bacterium CG2_30_59_28]|nr:hypothetical protein [Armatimonadota bacterium]OIO91915.1 MAG: hypothetical protein AUJ92_15465 [Armatimonadetes bacterium CG2_30_59_28]PIU60712.1 MAG: hypothetical protein COS85_23040 [Armatimonadetes bacterium CG07_land_8_20_14_0_80_59_28]PIX44957.1 MAG: hypothetical protein COZ56_03065 [Armatimonadetes bacterium CG_4_8_14_3_um_filter_58_9]
MGAVDSNFDRWLWIELIGFDNELEDFGVEAFMDNAGFVPDAASLLLFNPDFVHNHAGMEQARALPFDCCSYGGHPYNEQRTRQEWSSHQLRGLVRELQQRGVKVYVSVFDGFVTQHWIANHPEVLHVRKNGQQLASVCPWKRLSDGSFYEDFFVEQLLRVMRDYGFDGYHGADGYSHPRIPVYDGDFSDDMVGQFGDTTGISLPDDLRGACDGEAGAIEASGSVDSREYPSANTTITGNIFDMTEIGPASVARTAIEVSASDAIISDNQIYVRGACDPKVTAIKLTEPAVNVSVHDNLIQNCGSGLITGRALSRVGEVVDSKTFVPGWRTTPVDLQNP